ncbi:MAG: twin-arginine translocase subunit TatC [Gemmatimonadetes bacterium]|jgi:sec-independent protein translocase protein TatC|nr:twin-arginine translocase subunit TatC [Gemmatimonadota bacterium]
MRTLRGEMPFLDHLEELRWRIAWSVLSVAIGAGLGFWLVYHYDVLDLLIAPVRSASGDPDFQLQYLVPGGAFFITLRLAIYSGIIMAFPIVAYHVWSFLSPALDKREKRAIVPALYLGMVLFVAGMALAYFFALPATLKFFLLFETEALKSALEINETIGFIVKMLLVFGAMFELPIVVMLLSVMGLVTPRFLREKRRHAIVVITIVASFITPGDLIVLTVMMMVPLVLLYELGIFLSVLVYRGKDKRAKEFETSLDAPSNSVEKK